MESKIKIFKNFEEQEIYFLKYYFDMDYSGRLKALNELQKRNDKNFLIPKPRKITLYKK